MSWPEIKVADLPLVLAGPILRKVSSKSVSVWLALKSEATVFLTVKNGGEAVAYTDPIRTVRIGANLHLAFLTAVPEDDGELVPGVVYQYSVGFTVGTKSPTFAEATKDASFAYPTQTGPTFVLPPKKLDELRIIQGSCRKPHGESTDALEILDDLIAVTNDDATARPHLLLLGGDQIYADDVADDLLTSISDTAKKLMGWEETVQDAGTAKPVGGTTLPGGTARSAVVKAAGCRRPHADRRRGSSPAVAGVQAGRVAADHLARVSAFVRLASRDAGRADQGRAGAVGSLHDLDDDAVRPPRARDCTRDRPAPRSGGTRRDWAEFGQSCREKRASSAK